MHAHVERYEQGALTEGQFVMLHPGSMSMSMSTHRSHSNAGRIGRVVAAQGDRVVVRFAPGEIALCMLPRAAWFPVPRFMVEAFSSPALSGWRLSKRGASIASALGWKFTDQTVGKM